MRLRLIAIELIDGISSNDDFNGSDDYLDELEV
jgi:hypothetical protein